MKFAYIEKKHYLCRHNLIHRTMIEYIDRRNTNCIKWDSDESRGLLPLWVADMDFKTAPPILAAMQRRLDHGVFGYEYVPQAYYDAISSWFARRHGWKGITRRQIIYTTSVVSGISAILKAMVQPGEGVVVQTPAYNCFFSCLENMECRLLASPLKVIDNHYEVDWEQFEQQVQQAKIFLLCNPHNPTGRVWTRSELERMSAICERHGVFVISDEIHCEFTFPDVDYTPFATVAPTTNYCVCISPSKAFNLAGLHCANIFVPDEAVYARIDRAVNIHEVGEMNPFGVEALMAAYNESEAWLDELQQLIYSHYQYVCQFIREHLPCFSVTKEEGTYLAWVNISASGLSAEELCQRLARQEHVLFNPSEMYGAAGYIRINLATSRENLTEALQHLRKIIS